VYTHNRSRRNWKETNAYAALPHDQTNDVAGERIKRKEAKETGVGAGRLVYKRLRPALLSLHVLVSKCCIPFRRIFHIQAYVCAVCVC